MTELKIPAVFKFIGTCNCHGMFNRKYKYKDWIIYTTTTKFKVKKNGSTVKGYTDHKFLETYLQAIIPNIYVGREDANAASV